MTENKDKQEEQIIIRRIGSTTYHLHVRFSETAKETMEEKILRMIQNEALTKDEKSGIMKIPQMSRPA